MNKLVIALALIAAVAFAEEIAVSTKMIREINQHQNLWRAAHNHITRLPKSQARSLLGLSMEKLDHSMLSKKVYTAAEIANSPDEFDSRTNWPNCDSMKDIRDQRQCGSCWAFGAVEAMSDRICVVTTETVRLSAEDVTSCSGCGSCSGGQPACAWQYWVSTGIVTSSAFLMLLVLLALTSALILPSSTMRTSTRVPRPTLLLVRRTSRLMFLLMVPSKLASRFMLIS